MEITYTQKGDCLYPNVTLTADDQLPIGKYGRMRKKYLKDAIDAGASCYISESDYGLGSEACPEILVTDIRVAMPVIAEAFYGRLSDKLVENA